MVSSTIMESKNRVITRMAIMLIFFFACMFISIPGNAQGTRDISGKTNLETYIVHVSLPTESRTPRTEDLDIWYRSFLPKTAEMDEPPRLVHSYYHVVTGFAAKLSPEEVKETEKKEGFISARPQRVLPMHTTHSPAFLGLRQNVGFWHHANFGKGIIIGVFDTGITPDHPSFSDDDMPPPPAKWKGKCELNGTSCNNKLIGARDFVRFLSDSPIDEVGHGTHTASTAAGHPVPGANVFDMANGTATGMAPLAHLAIYKVCTIIGCFDADILAAMDAAVEDGVDIMSLSLGGSPLPFHNDSVAVAAFGAIRHGIFVSCSAGNSGPVLNSMSNEAPWMLTVGASTTDRQIRATAVLGNGDEYDGESLFQPKDFPDTMLPLVYPGANGDRDAALCIPGSLKRAAVKGKIVLCERGGGFGRTQKGEIVKNAGGAAMILMNEKIDGYTTFADPHVLPATHVSYKAGSEIRKYINSTSTPEATISFKGTIIGDLNAPAITSFSSRGPSSESPGILKPDIIGPGLNILAAWNPETDNKTTNTNFSVISGTSMSCPHLSGIAALLKSSHPDWSPAAIKSAIMTSADVKNRGHLPIFDEQMNPADIFATGAGHVNPARADDPGLIYDLQPDDYVPYLCGLKYTSKEVGTIVHRHVNCSKIKSIPEAQLNYPSFAIKLGSRNKTYTRTVTNVGNATSVYHAKIESIPGVKVHVKPSELKFTEVKQKMTYEVVFSRTDNPTWDTYVQGAITWVSDKNRVRTPISVRLL